MIRARFSPKAVRDLDEHCGHIAADNPEAAERVRRTILSAADLLAQHRELGRRIRKAEPRHAQIRWFVVPKFRNLTTASFTSHSRRQSWWSVSFIAHRTGLVSFPLRKIRPRRLTDRDAPSSRRRCSR